MPRLLFEKKGMAIWISHLDLMRVFQRAFKRAGLPLTHSHGFNPRPSVSIALPLSVGIESECELLDFALDGCEVTCDEIRSRLNATLISGIRVLDVYDEGRKIRDLSLLRCEITMVYDHGLPQGAEKAIRQLFAEDAVVVPKKTKSGVQDQNIISMIRSLDVATEGNKVILRALICCQNPTLNPAQIPLAVSTHLSCFAPDFVVCKRLEIFDSNKKIFR